MEVILTINQTEELSTNKEYVRITCKVIESMYNDESHIKTCDSISAIANLINSKSIIPVLIDDDKIKLIGTNYIISVTR